MSKSSNVNIIALFTAMFITRRLCSVRIVVGANMYFNLPVTSWSPNLLCKLHFYTTIDTYILIFVKIEESNCGNLSKMLFSIKYQVP